MTLALARPLLLAVTLCFTTPACAQQPAPAAAEAGNNNAQAAADPAPAIYSYRIVHTYPHDRNAFTQGLFYLDGKFYESTGQIGQSTIRHVNIEDGRVLRSVPIPPVPTPRARHPGVAATGNSGTPKTAKR